MCAAGAADAGSHPRRVDRGRLLDHDGGADAGLAERLSCGKLINALPHITVSDERREPPRQPAESDYAATPKSTA
jgi:hypothetical protein